MLYVPNDDDDDDDDNDDDDDDTIRSDSPNIVSPSVIINNQISVNINTTTTTILTVL